jgi:hypothetical protein
MVHVRVARGGGTSPMCSLADEREESIWWQRVGAQNVYGDGFKCVSVKGWRS